jgi:hypothetical protein
MKYLFEQIGDQKLLVSILEEEKFPESEEELIKKAEKSMGWIDFQTLHTDYGTLYLGRSKFKKEGRVLDKCLLSRNSDYLLPILSVHARTKGPKTFRICFTNKGTFRTTKGCWCKTTKHFVYSSLHLCHFFFFLIIEIDTRVDRRRPQGFNESLANFIA